jgi:hypothetical protein
MDLNFVALGYFFLRLAPFVLVSFFSLSSIFNKDFKGLVYLIGLIVSCFGTMMSASLVDMVSDTLLTLPDARPEICSLFTQNGMEMSRLPLGQSIFAYTFMYLLYGMITNSSVPDDKKDAPWYVKLVSSTNTLIYQNIPTIIFFSLLIIFDFAWNIQYSCYKWHQLLISLVLGGTFGFFWGVIIDSTKTDSLKYFNGYSNSEVCSKPSQQTFRCKVYKNGVVIADNFS